MFCLAQRKGLGAVCQDPKTFGQSYTSATMGVPRVLDIDIDRILLKT